MKNLLVIVFILFCWSCTPKKETIPPGVVSSDTMIQILSNMHLAQASIAVNTISDSNTYTMADYQQYILDQYKIPKADFIKSIRYYTANPELFKNVYDSILIVLTRSEAETKK